jgi:cellulose synthase/poly-beta-1,6-N-acetylglucosamine synthase-like glycosyltransferase
VTIWIFVLAFWLPFPFLALRAHRALRSLPALPGTDLQSGPLPSLSVIIPARDEAENLAQLLPSLAAQAYPGELDVIVVDDGSADATARTAAGGGAAVIAVDGPPHGWLGKPHAAHLGALAATGEWLLFTDADTLHGPDSAARAVRYACDQALDGLSLLLRERASGHASRLVTAIAFAGLFAGLQPARPLLNGQYILIRRQTYFESGGFAAVRGEPLEDLALAHRLRSHGVRFRLTAGFDAAEVRSAGGFRSLWSSLTRWTAGALRWSGGGAWLTALFITGAMVPVPALPLAIFAGIPAGWAIAAWAGAALGFVPWVRLTGGGPAALLSPVGALIVQAAALNGLVRRVFGAGFQWKGRRV